MRTVYYDFYSEDFILYIPTDFSVVEIGVREPRISVNSNIKKFIPYIMCHLSNERDLLPRAHRFTVIPLCEDTRLRSEGTVQGGCPVAGTQQVRDLTTGGTRPMQNLAAHENTSHMRLIGKFSLPAAAALFKDSDKQNPNDANASHLLFMETSNVIQASQSVQTTATSVAVNENSIRRRL